MCVEMKGERVWLFNQGSKDLLGLGKHDKEWGEGRGVTSNRTTKNKGAKIRPEVKRKRQL